MTTSKFLDEIHSIFTGCEQILVKKNKDYGSTSDPFKNFRMVENIGLTSVEKGILVRMMDKISRIVNIVDKEPEVKSESVSDTLDDLINYAAILKTYIGQR
jgi:hypothetical protein